MTISRPPLQNSLHRIPREYPLGPAPNVRPILDIHAQELEHPRHGEWKVRDVGNGRPIGQSYKVLSGQGKLLV